MRSSTSNFVCNLDSDFGEHGPRLCFGVRQKAHEFWVSHSGRKTLLEVISGTYRNV